MQVPILKGDNIGPDAQWSDALPQNMFGVLKPILGASGYMSAYPGFNIYTVITGVGQGAPDRGAIWVDRGDDELSGHYRIQGTQFAKITKGFDGETVEFNDAIGEIPGSNQTSMAYSFNNLAIVAEGRLYYYNPIDGLREITGPNVGNPIDIVWGKNLFILTDGVNIYHSNTLNEEEFLPLDFGSADFRPDPSLGLAFNEDSELIAFGTESVEHFRINANPTGFLFTNVDQKAQKIGITGTHAKGEYANTYYMLGSRVNTQLGMYMTESGTSKRISSLTIERRLRGYKQHELNDVIVEAIEVDGTTLVLFHLPDIVYCFNRQMFQQGGADSAWCTLTSNDGNDLYTQVGHRLINYVRDKNLSLWLAGSKQTSGIFFLDVEAGNQVQYPQECILYSPFVRLETLSVNKIEMDTISGFGNSPTIVGSTNEINTTFISRTDDGITYSKEWSRQYGQQGDYGVRFIANRMGYVREFTSFKFRTYTDQRCAFAYLTVDAS